MCIAYSFHSVPHQQNANSERLDLEPVEIIGKKYETQVSDTSRLNE